MKEEGRFGDANESDNEDDPANEAQYDRVYCGECTKKFTTRQRLRNHLKKVHQKDPWNCPNEECLASFPTQKALKGHVATTHKKEEVWFFVAIQFWFKSERALVEIWIITPIYQKLDSGSSWLFLVWIMFYFLFNTNVL